MIPTRTPSDGAARKPAQYEALHAGLELREQSRDERIRFLEEELAKARAA